MEHRSSTRARHLTLFLVGRSGNSSFGFCNIFLFPGAGYQPAAPSPTWRTRGCSSSGLNLLTNPAWLDLPGTKVPASTALWVIETHKLHHHGKVSAQGEEQQPYFIGFCRVDFSQSQLFYVVRSALAVFCMLKMADQNSGAFCHVKHGMASSFSLKTVSDCQKVNTAANE